LLIQHIRSYPPYLEAVSSVRNPRTRHDVAKVDPLNMDAVSGRNNHYYDDGAALVLMMMLFLTITIIMLTTVLRWS
jgi:hypothetical protein